MFKLAMLSVALMTAACATDDLNTGEAASGLITINRCQHSPMFPDDPNCVELTPVGPDGWNEYMCGSPGNCDLTQSNFTWPVQCHTACGLPSLQEYGSAPHSTYNTLACIDSAKAVGQRNPSGIGWCMVTLRNN
jgi:hypothetical protein